jgi:hypothetical protein
MAALFATAAMLLWLMSRVVLRCLICKSLAKWRGAEKWSCLEHFVRMKQLFS